MITLREVLLGMFFVTGLAGFTLAVIQWRAESPDTKKSLIIGVVFMVFALLIIFKGVKP